MDDGGQLHQQIVGQIVHLGPVGDVGPHNQLGAGISLAKAVVQAVVIYGLIKVVGVVHRRVVDIRGSCDTSAV